MTRIPDIIDPARANALAVTLGLGARFEAGVPLPPFFHNVYFWDPVEEAGLGVDGHPRTGAGLIPDLKLPRRMWAGGRLAFHAEFRAGVPADKATTAESVEIKEGRTGKLGFVTLRHDIHQGGALCLTEWQDLVYREAPSATAPAPLIRRAPEDEAPETHRFSSTTLFRYSALTFNGHRIHYDLDFARGSEGYGGLVTHGPLLAQLLMLRATREMGPLAGFRYTAKAPILSSEPVTTCRYGPSLWVRGEDGRLAMEAEATPA